MATALTQFTAGDYGGAGADPALVVGIGGTAAAGDWIEVTTCGIDGGGDQPTVVTDDAGGSYELLFDHTDSEGWRTLGWAKLCVGGETTVTATWPSSSNRTLTGFWAATPSLPTLYLIASGAMTFTGAHMSFFAPDGSILTDGSTYVGGMSSGRGPITNANFGNPPSIGAQGGDGTVLAGACKTIAHYNEDEGGHVTTDVLEYIVEPEQAAYSYWIGFTDAPPTVDLETTGGLVGGEAELTVTPGEATLESEGGIVGGLSELTTTGGGSELETSGGIVGGSAHLSAPAPFPPVPNEPPMTGTLGCGIYDVLIFTRGLTEIVGRAPFNTLQWGRVLDDTSQAQVTINGVSNVGSMRDCCALLGSIMPWEHELAIYRNGIREWSGPVTKVTYPSETVVIYARDLSTWLAKRCLHEIHNDVQVDLAEIWAGYVADAMGVDNSAGLYAIVQAQTGVLADRLETPDMGTYAADAIAELARTGLDWTCTDRRMVGGPVPVQPPAYPDAPPIPTLIDESFRDAPEVDRDGDLMADAWFVGGTGPGPAGAAIFGQYGPHFDATDDHLETPAAPDYAAIEAQFGRIEARANETKILDQDSIDQNAATRYDLTKLPVDVIGSGTLLPSAGIDMRQLTAGSVQNIHLSRACAQIGAPYRLKQLAVTGQSDGAEDVECTWEPLGSEAAHEDL